MYSDDVQDQMASTLRVFAPLAVVNWSKNVLSTENCHRHPSPPGDSLSPFGALSVTQDQLILMLLNAVCVEVMCIYVHDWMFVYHATF